MIWYETEFWTPYAPGEGQDGGPPSVERMFCGDCENWTEVEFNEKEGRCVDCRRVLLAQL